MSCDIIRARNKKGIMVYKSRTPEGAEFLGKQLRGPWHMARDVLMDETPFLEAAIRDAGLTLEDYVPPSV